MANTFRVFEVFRHHRMLSHDDGYHRKALAFIRSVGLRPDRIKPEWIVVQNGPFYELHVSELDTGADGKPVLDLAAGECVTHPVIVSLGPVAGGVCWPEPGGVPGQLSFALEATDAVAGA